MENNLICGISGVAQLYQPIEEKGVAKITCFEITADECIIANLRYLRDGGRMFTIKEGKYCRLSVNKELMMSDTPMERRSNADFVQVANGRVFIAGLGLGMIINAILDKEEVTEVVVIEKYQDVIDLVAPKFNNPKLKIICADIFEYLPEKKEKFDTIYFDIWADITTENLKEIKILHNKYKNFLNRKNDNCYMESWLKEYLQQCKRREDR
jgi:predicted membrane-bound spermidine synthase